MTRYDALKAVAGARRGGQQASLVKKTVDNKDEYGFKTVAKIGKRYVTSTTFEGKE